MKIDEIQKKISKKDLKNLAQNVEPFEQFDDLHRRNSTFSRSASNHQ